MSLPNYFTEDFSPQDLDQFMKKPNRRNPHKERKETRGRVSRSNTSLAGEALHYFSESLTG